MSEENKRPEEPAEQTAQEGAQQEPVREEQSAQETAQDQSAAEKAEKGAKGKKKKEKTYTLTREHHQGKGRHLSGCQGGHHPGIFGCVRQSGAGGIHRGGR